MSRTLLVDTNRGAYPIYQALCELGHEVSVVGGVPSEPLAKICPRYFRFNYSDTGRLASFVASEGFDFLVPGCTDVSYWSTAEINDSRFPGFDTIETSHRLTEKASFRELATALDIPVPRVLSPPTAASAAAIIVKPVDSYSGRGIEVVRNPTPEAIDAAIGLASAESRTGTAIMEEYVAGQLYSHSAFVRAGRIVTDFFVREDCTSSRFAVDCSYVAEDLPQALVADMRRVVLKLASGLDLVDGLVHLQFITDGAQYWVIEATRRCPGDLYSLLIELSTGYRYAANYVAQFVGNEAQPCAQKPGGDLMIRHTVAIRDGASLWGLRFNRAVAMRLVVPLATAGDTLAPSPAGRAAIIFLGASSVAERDQIYEALLSGTLYSIESAE